MPQNVINSKELQGKTVNPQLYLDILNIHLSVTDRTNTQMKHHKVKKKKFSKAIQKIQTRLTHLN